MNGKIQYGPARTLNFAATRSRRRLADPARFPRVPHTSRALALVVGAALLAAVGLAAVPRQIPGAAAVTLLGAAWLAMVLAVTLPSGSEVAGVELSRRLGRFRHALNSVGDDPSRDVLMKLLVLRDELGLREDEVAEEMAQIRASLDALDLRERLARGDLPVVAGVAPLPPDDECHFMCPVRFGRRRSDQFGHLLLTSGWLRFRGALDLSVAWTEVSSVQRCGREVIVNLQDSTRALRFGCHTLEESTRGAVLADHLAQRARHEEPDRDSSIHATL